MWQRTGVVFALGLMLAGQPVFAASTNFENFTPLATSVPGGSLPETMPLSLASPNFSQRTAAVNDRGPQNGNVKLGDNWDMTTLNENGPSAGRYLFSPYETGSAGVRRVDLVTGTAATIVPEGTQGFVAGDASRWTPWSTYLTAEESWGTGSTKGRLFEVTNPLAAPGTVNFVQRNILPRVSHEGLAFDKSNNLYFVDELNGGSLYKYTSATPNTGTTFFSAGQTFVLRIGAGGQNEGSGAAVTGGATWVPITDANGAPLAGIPTIAGGDIDGRAAKGLAAISGSGYNRPEDLEMQTLTNGSQLLYFNTTDAGPGGNGRTYALNLATNQVSLFVDKNTLNEATGLAVGNDFRNPDNLAVDAAGNIYIVEDQPGGVADIWFARDVNRDGIAESIGRWASMSTLGAEPTGLYFSPFDANVAYVNIQHADSDLDRTIEINAVPEPATYALMLGGLTVLGILGRRRWRK